MKVERIIAKTGSGVFHISSAIICDTPAKTTMHDITVSHVVRTPCVSIPYTTPYAATPMATGNPSFIPSLNA